MGGSSILTLQQANTYTGTTTVSGMPLILSGNGSLASPITLNQGGTLTLDNTTINSTTRVAATALTLNGGTLNFLGLPGAASSQTLGAVTLGAGTSTIACNPGNRERLPDLHQPDTRRRVRRLPSSSAAPTWHQQQHHYLHHGPNSDRDRPTKRHGFAALRHRQRH